jgi:hypothetical protein
MSLTVTTHYVVRQHERQMRMQCIQRVCLLSAPQMYIQR